MTPSKKKTKHLAKKIFQTNVEIKTKEVLKDLGNLEHEDIAKLIKDFSKKITNLLFRSNKYSSFADKEYSNAQSTAISSELSQAKASKIVERVRKVHGRVIGTDIDKPMITTSVVSPVKQIKTRILSTEKRVDKTLTTRKNIKPKGEKEV